MTSQEAAAWTQAVGSVVAILVAIAVPYLIRRADRAREAMVNVVRAKGFALELLPGIERLHSTLLIARGELRRDDAYLYMDEIAEKLVIPSALENSARYLHELGPVANRVQDVIAAAGKVRRLVEAEYDYNQSAGVLNLPDGEEIALDEPESFELPLNAAIDKINLAIYELNAMFEGNNN